MGFNGFWRDEVRDICPSSPNVTEEWLNSAVCDVRDVTYKQQGPADKKEQSHVRCLRGRSGDQRWRQGGGGRTAGGRRFQCTLSVVAESRPQNPWVGLLARKGESHFADSLAASPSPADGPSGYSKRRAFTYSGGTAPDSHRTSLLCPSRAPKQDRGYTTTRSVGTNRSRRAS